jgi:primosomal replication protein N
LTAIQALRYSPAGVAILDASGRVDEQVSEAGAARQVQFEMSLRFTEALAIQASRLPLGSLLQLEGFIAPIRMHARSMRMHVQDMKIIEGN